MTALPQTFVKETTTGREIGQQGSRLLSSLATGSCLLIMGACAVLHLPMIIFFAVMCALGAVLRRREHR